MKVEGLPLAVTSKETGKENPLLLDKKGQAPSNPQLLLSVVCGGPKGTTIYNRKKTPHGHNLCIRLFAA